MVCTLSKHKRARPANPTTPCPCPGGCTTVPCTPPSTQHKRARRPAQPTTATPTAAVPEPDWSTLAPDLVHRVGDRVLAADDIDYYMAFRAVCHNWRRALKDNNAADCSTDDPTCFQPSKWAVLDRQGDDVLALVNLETGRFLRKRIPLLRHYFFVSAASGGLLLLAEPTYPYRARLLNPFTGALARFKAPVPVDEAREVAVVATSPLTTTVFVSMLADGAVMWADQDSNYFRKCAAPAPYPDDGLLCMVPFAGDLYLTNRQGAVLSTAAAAVIDDDGACQGRRCRRSAQSISVATAIPEALLGSHCHYYLVESGGELLLVTRPAWHGVPGDQLAIHRVDTVRNVLEPVSSIGSRAFFLSRVRCLSVDAGKFPAVQGGCIYFVDQIFTGTGSCYFDVQFSFMTVVRFPVPDADGVRQPQPMPADCFQPFTLTHVFANYCKFVQCSELRRQIMIDGEEEFSEDDEEDSDGDEGDYFSDDDDGPDEGSSESDQ